MIGLLALGYYTTIVLIVLTIWCLYWKIRGLWNSARDNNKLWFALIFFFNTAGILPIIYIYYVRKHRKSKKFK